MWNVIDGPIEIWSSGTGAVVVQTGAVIDGIDDAKHLPEIIKKYPNAKLTLEKAYLSEQLLSPFHWPALTGE